MAGKTERFEMRLDADTIERIDEWRFQHGDMPSRAEAIRRLVDRGLEQPSTKDFRLSKPERLMTWLLTEILKCQKGFKDGNTVSLIQEVIYGGHDWALEWDMTGVLHSHTDSRVVVSEVGNILDMWWFIERAYGDLEIDQKAHIEAAIGPLGRNPKFAGFDGNNESEHMGIARFFVDHMNRFTHFKGRDFNSHFPSVARYLRMYEIFEPMRVNLIGRELSADQIIILLKTGIAAR